MTQTLVGRPGEHLLQEPVEVLTSATFLECTSSETAMVIYAVHSDPKLARVILARRTVPRV